MLKTRVLTAVVLLAVFLPSLFFLPQLYWALLCALISGVAAWEWGGLLGAGSRSRLAYGGLLAVLCALAVVAAPAAVGAALPPVPGHPAVFAIYSLAAAFWFAMVPLWLRSRWHLAGSSFGWVVGLVVIVPAWLALVQLRLLGPAALLAVLALVWIADIAAYFFGKTFGRRKLAPTISPGKTWEGAMGAAATVLAYGLALRQAFSLGGMPALWCLALVAITAVSVIGDLFESMLKRQTGLKDSSHVLPGHGGVLDRIDSLTSTLPTVALLWLIFGFDTP